MIVGVRWFRHADDDAWVLQCREENGPWRPVPYVLGPIWQPERAPDPVHEVLRGMGNEP